jgi:hypothetical protein
VIEKRENSRQLCTQSSGLNGSWLTKPLGIPHIT